MNHMRLKQALLFIITAFTFINTASGEATLNTKVPTSIIHIGYNSGSFSIQFINDTIGPAENMSITIDQPDGVYIKESTLQASINSQPVTPGNISLSDDVVTITESVPAGDTLILAYEASASCAAIPAYHDAGTPVIYTNNITIDYTVAGSTGSKSQETNSYNVKYAELLVYTPEGSESGMDVVWQETYTRKIPVKNGNGAGTTDSIKILIHYNDSTIIELQRLVIANAADTTQKHTLPFPAKKEGKYITWITPTELAQINLGNSFNGGEQFIIRETFKVVKNTVTHTTTYVAEWYANDSACNKGYGNATGTLYLNQDEAFANLKHTIYIPQKPTLCDTSCLFRIRIENNDTSIINNALNITYEIYGISKYTIHSASINNTHPVPFRFSYNKNSVYFDSIGNDGDPDGPGTGLEDLDGDGIYDDLPFGEYFDLYVDVSYPSANDLKNFMSTRFYLYYDDISGEDYRKYNSLYDRFSKILSSVDGSSDLMYGEPAIMQYSTSKQYGPRFKILSCDSISYHILATFPSGASLNPDSTVLLNDSPANYSTLTNGIKIHDVSLNSDVSLYLDYACEAGSGTKNISWEFFHQCNSCTNYFSMDSKDFSTVAHSVSCDTTAGGDSIGNACFSMDQFPDFNVERTTLGYKKSAHSGIVWYESDLATAPKVTEEDNPKLNTALVNDEISVSLTSTIYKAGCTPDKIIARVFYGDTNKLFDVSSAEIMLNGTPHNVNVSNINEYVDGSNYVMDFELTPGNVPVGEIKLNAVMTVREDATNNYLHLSYFRGMFKMEFNANNDVATDHFGDYLHIYKPSRLSLDYYAWKHDDCSKQHRFGFYSSQDFDFGDEFRSISHVLEPLKIKIPQGYTLDTSNKIRLYYSNRKTSTVIVIDYSKAQMNNGYLEINYDFPLLKDQSYLQIHYFTKALCSVDDQTIYDDLDYKETRYDYSNPVPNTNVLNGTKKIYYSYSKPKLSLTTETNQPGYTRSVTWTAYLYNNSTQTDAPNCWLALHESPHNIANIRINKILVDSVDMTSELFYAGGKQMINLGRLKKNSNSFTIHITAGYTNCSFNNKDTLFVDGGWSCAPVTAQDADACQSFSDYFTLTNKVADIQAESYSEHPDSLYDACQKIGYTVDINSSAFGYLYNMGFWITLPSKDVVLTDSVVYWTYEGENGVMYDNMGLSKEKLVFYSDMEKIGDKEEKNDTAQNSLISFAIKESKRLPDGFKGGGDTIKLHLGVEAKCPEEGPMNLGDNDDWVRFTVQAETNCHDKLRPRVYPYRVPLKWFEDLDSIYISASGTGFTDRHDTTSLEVQVTNIAGKHVDSVFIEAYLPPALAYIPGTTTIPGVEPASEPRGSGTLLTWVLPSVQYMAANDTLTFTFDVADVTNCPPSQATIGLSANLMRYIDGCDEGCMARATADRDKVTLDITPVSMPGTPAGPVTVCQGTSHNYMISAVERATGYEWGIIPSHAATITYTDTMASVSFTHGHTGTTRLFVIGLNNACSEGDTSFLDMDILESPVPVLTDTFLCKGDSVVLNPGVFDTYAWSAGDTTRTITVVHEDTYRVTVGYNNGCTVTDTARVLFYSLPDITAHDDTTFTAYCYSTAPVTLDAGPGFTSYLWHHDGWAADSAQQAISVNNTGLYMLTVTESHGCQATDTFRVINYDFVFGDVDRKPGVDIYDATFLYEYVFGDDPAVKDYAPPYIHLAGDVTAPCGEHTAADVIDIARYPSTELAKCYCDSTNLKSGTATNYSINMYIEGGYLWVEKTGDMKYFTLWEMHYDTTKTVELGTPEELTGGTWIFDYNFTDTNRIFFLNWIRNLYSPVPDGPILRIPITLTADSIHVKTEYNYAYHYHDVKLKTLTSSEEWLTTGKDIHIYPNPVNSRLNIVSSTPIQQALLINTSGNIATSRHRVNTTETTLETSELPAGMYILKIITTDGRMKTVKIEKE